MSEKEKRGKGKPPHPWENTHIRCPRPIKDEMESLIRKWKAEQLEAGRVSA